MATVDVGDVLPNFGFTVTDNSTGLIGAPSTFTVALTAPDGTTPTVTVTNPSTGIYAVSYVATQAGRYVAVGTAVGNGCDGVFTLVWGVAATAASDQPIVGAEELRKHLGKSITASDEDLRRYGLIATELAEEWLGRAMRRRTVTNERHDGGVAEVALYVTPVQSVTSVTLVYGGTLDSSVYLLDDVAGILVARSRAFPGGRGELLVTYLAGPTGILPARYVQGAMEIARHLWDTQRGGSNLPRQQGADDTWVSGSGWSVPKRVMELLGPHAPGIA